MTPEEESDSVSDTLSCGNCHTSFGDSRKILKKLTFKCSELTTYRLKCKVCNKVLYRKTLMIHFVSHFNNNDIHCMICQTIENDVVYDLDTPEASLELEEMRRNETMANLPPNSLNEMNEMSPSCGKCGDRFDDAIGLFHKLYESDRYAEVEEIPIAALYCCAICGKCNSNLTMMKDDIFTHFQNQMVWCRICYETLSPPNIPKISIIEDNSVRSGKTVSNYNPHLKINCGNCGKYIADSVILQPPQVRRYIKYLDGGELAIQMKTCYKCVVCLQIMIFTEMANHIVQHINSSHIFCNQCQDTNQGGMISIRSGLIRPRQTDLRVPCGKCNNKFTSEDLQLSVRSFVLESNTKGYCRRYIYFCEICRRKFASKTNIKSHVVAHISNNDIFCSSCTSKIKE